MSWMEHIEHKLERYRNRTPEGQDSFVKQLSGYLRREWGWNDSAEVLERTVQDVLTLDADLLHFVKEFILEQRVETEGLACGSWFTMEEFLEHTGCTPVTAALFFQMYRTNRTEAMKSFLMQDIILADPEP